VRDGVSKLTWATDAFALAEGVSEESGEYRGLIAGMRSDAPIGSTAVLVKPARAEPLLKDQAQAELPGEGGSGHDSEQGDADDGEEKSTPTRFYGRIELDPVRFGRQLGQISDEVIAHLNRADGARLVLSFEIEASTPDGFDDAARRVVGENASTLKFEEHRFED
jgi:hypothetical protein